jgi:hypothetical protein
MLRRRLATLVAVPVAAIAIAGCGVEEVTTEASTEGIWVDAGSLDYQVQGSRLLEPGTQVPDQSYLKGIADGITAPNADEVWFAVFLRIENKTDETVPTAEDFEITDTVGNVFKPVAIDPEVNPFAYKSIELEPKGVVPDLDSAQALDSAQGAELLFKIPLTSYANRPLEFKVVGNDAGGPAEATVDLDV